MADQVFCELCGRAVQRHTSYVVRIDVFADPSMPPLATDEEGGPSFDESLADLLDQMKDMSTDELQDDVHRRFEYHVCRPCQRRLLANPLGRPREVRVGKN